MNNFEQYDYTRDKNKLGDVGLKGDIDPEKSSVHDNFSYDEGMEDSSDEDSSVNDYEQLLRSLDSYEKDEFKYLTDFEQYKNSSQYDESYDRLYKTYSRHKTKKDWVKSKDPDYQNNAGFDYVKEYYASNMLAKQNESTQKIRFFTIIVIPIFLFTFIALFSMANNTTKHPAIYIERNPHITLSESITKDEINAFRTNIDTKKMNTEKNAHEIQKNMVDKLKETEKPVQAIVNNYNFEQLNTGLTTLGYSLLACFIAFFSFKGLSTISKSFKLKREIKKSIRLLNDFKSVISQQNNQLEISQLINDQIVINNILIERLNNNNNVVKLIAINEKMKDTSQFLNNNLIENLKGD